MILQKTGKKLIEFVCRLRAVHTETTSSELLLKKCVFVFCIFIMLRSDPHLRKGWTVFFPHFALVNRLPYCTSHSLRLILRPKVLYSLFLSLLDLQYGGHQSIWPWSCQHSERSMRRTGPDCWAPGCSTLCVPGTAASHPGL